MRIPIPLICGLLACCGTSHTLVLEQADDMNYLPGVAPPATFELRALPSPGAEVPAEMRASFEDRIRFRLEGSRVSGLLIEYRFVHAGGDDQIDRWFTGGSGRRTVTVDVVFKNEDDERLARIQAEGRFQPGLLGGSLASATLVAADEVAEYAVATFGR